MQMSLRQTLIAKHNRMCLVLEMHVCHFWCLDEVHTFELAGGNMKEKEKQKEKEKERETRNWVGGYCIKSSTYVCL